MVGICTASGVETGEGRGFDNAARGSSEVEERLEAWSRISHVSESGWAFWLGAGRRAVVTFRAGIFREFVLAPLSDDSLVSNVRYRAYISA
jgi:hypothetical protein